MLVEDGTGQMDVQRWLDPGQILDLEGFEVGTYVRILAAIKEFNGKRHVEGANSIHVIEDKNEIQFHICDVIYAHLTHSRGPAGGAEAVPQKAGNRGATGGGGGGGYSAYSGLRGVQKKIMEHISSLGDDLPQNGINIHALGGKADAIKKEVQSLVADGHLYNSIDDDHVLSTAGA